MRLAICILLTASAAAQVQGNRPELVDAGNTSFFAQTTPNAYTMPENVAVNDTIDVCVVSFDGLATAYGVTDTLGNTYTLTAGTALPNLVQNLGFIYHAYTRSGFAGPDTITVAQPSPSGLNIHISASRYTGLNGVDGSVATGTENQRPLGGIFSVSTTNTTTVNGDVLSSCLAAGTYNQDGRITPQTGEYNDWGHNGGGADSAMQHQHTGALGSQTMTANTYAANAFDGAASFGMQTLAFKPDAIKITDTVMPDGVVGSVYSAQLHGVGGTAGLTYACTGLPSHGLTLNTSTGVISGATPTLGAVAIGCTVTDGTLTSSTASLTVTINSTIQTPTVRAVFASSFDPNGSWQTVTGQCNDILIVFARGIDTHYFDGGVQVANGTGNYISALNTTWRRLEGAIPGVLASGYEIFVSSPLRVVGNVNLTFANNQGASSANPVSLVLDVTGGELVDQAIGTSTMTSTATGTWGGSYTSLVNNVLLLAANVTGGEDFSNSATMSLPGSFATLSTGGDAAGLSLYSSALLTTPQTINATVTYASGSTSHQTWMQALLPIRPAPVAGACTTAFTGNGERIRKQSF